MKLATSKIVLSVVALAAVVVVATAPQLLGPKVDEALSSVAGANPVWLAAAAAAYAVAFLASAAAWRSALGACGGRVSLQDVSARIGVGCLVNTVAPAKLGDAVKVALCAKALDGRDRIWTASGLYAGLGAAHALALAALVVAASATGAAPLWPVFVLCGAVAVVGALALSSPRWRNHHRIEHLLGGFAALARSPRAAAEVVGWTAAASAARVGAAAAAATALDLPSPFLAALVILPAMDLAGTIPLTPGNVGVGSGAAALALQSRGIGVADAIGVGIAMQALQTAVSVAVGTAGALYLAQPRGTARRWTARGAVALGVSLALAALVGAFVLDWA
jgi:uncharacterized membrane protein YbhN (UPF0104 family)